MLSNVDLRTTPFIGGDTLRLPAQALPSSKKNEKWFKATMDSLEAIGIRQTNLYRKRFEDAYRIVEGSYAYSEITNTSAFLDSVDFLREQADLPEDIEHYGFIEPIINSLVGEYLKKPNSNIIHAEDPLSTNEYLRARTDMLWEGVAKQIQAEIELKMLRRGLNPYQKEFKSEEEKQQYMQQLEQFRKQNTPKQVEKEMNTGYRPYFVQWAEKTLEESKIRYQLEEQNRELLKDYLVTGRCFRHYRMGYDYMTPERWSPINTFTSVSQDVKYPQLGDYVGRVQHLTPNDIIINYGHKLTERQKKKILRSEIYESNELSGTNITSTQSWVENFGATRHWKRHPQEIQYENLGYLQEQLGVDLGYRDWFPNENVDLNLLFSNNEIRHDLIRVTESYWVSYKRVGYLNFLVEETGERISTTVTDEVLKDFIQDYGIKKLTSVSLEQNEKNPQDNTIVWDYIPEVWYGVKISMDNTDLTEDLYLYGEPLGYQLHGESSIFHTVLPVTGIVENTSLVSRVEIDQIEYSMALNMARDYMSKELGVFFLMDLAYMPEFIKDFGADEALDKLAEITRMLGLLPLDSSQARGTQFNNFQMVNMDLTAAMMGKMELARAIKVRAFEKLGLTPQRMAMPVEIETAEGIRVNQDASYSQTEVWFDKFANFEQRDAEVMLNVIQWMHYNDMDVTVNYTDSDGERQFMQMNDPDLPMRKFRIYPQNNSKRRHELEVIKKTFFQDNTIEKTLEVMTEVMTADSVSKVMQAARLQRKQQQLEAELAQQRQLEQIELQAQKEQEAKAAEHEREKEIVRLKGEIDLTKQAILAMGFAEDKDMNNNNIPDVVEQMKTQVRALESQHKQMVAEQEQRRKQVKDAKEEALEMKKLQLEEKKIDVQDRQSQRQLQIAKTNKNRYDKPQK